MYVVPTAGADGRRLGATAKPEIIAISLQVAVSNVRARRFYERFGFLIFGPEQRSRFAAGRLYEVRYME